MRFPKILAFLLVLASISAQAQQKTVSLPLKEAISIALSKSDEAVLANAKVQTKQYESQSVKMNQYPDFKISGQYMRLTNADVNLKSSKEASQESTSGGTTENRQESPKVNQLIFGQAGVSMPLFSGFKLHNSINASENVYKAETANAAHSNEVTAMKVVQYYADLYKAQKAVELYKESLKSSNQRVTDFTAMEQNGLIARNDLLKAQLQESKIKLSLADAQKNLRLLNYNLTTLLKMDPATQIVVSEDNVDASVFGFGVKTEAEALQNRQDLQAVDYLKKAGDANIKVAQAAYYPSLSLSAGYVAMDIQNLVRVENAMNVGVGLSYNLSSLFKNGKEVKAAKSRAKEIETQQSMLTDAIKEQVVQAQANYELALQQDQVYTEAVGQADENYRIVKDKYDNGLVDTNDLLEADVEDLGAKINQANAKANVVLKYYELLEASGTITQSLNFSKN